MQNFLPTTNTTPGFLALDYFTPGPSEGFNQVRNDKLVDYSIQPVQKNSEGAANAFIPDHETGDTYSMAIGNFDVAPTDGTVALQVGAQTGGDLATIPATVTGAALQSALNTALTAESKPQVQILALGNGSYIGTATSNGAITDGFFGVVSASLLYPIANAFFTIESLGSGSSPYRFLFTMRQAPFCYSEPDTELPATDVTVEPTQMQAVGQSAVRTVLFTVPQVSAGSFTLGATALGEDATCGAATPLMSARDFGLLLANHPEINYSTPGFDDNIAVTVSGQSWVVTAIGTLDADATFEITATNSPDDPLIGPKGLSGKINYNTFGLLAYSRSQVGETFTLTRQIQRYRGTETRTLTSTPVEIFKELIDASTAVPTPTINYYTASQVDALLLDKMDVDAGNATLPDALNNLLPSQAGNAGKVLKTDGTDVAWQTDASVAPIRSYITTSVPNIATNSTTLTNTALAVTLTDGEWIVSASAAASSTSFAVAGSKIQFASSGSGSVTEKGTELLYTNPASAEPNDFGALKQWPFSSSQFLNYGSTTNGSGSIFVKYQTTLVVTGIVTITCQVAQNTAVTAESAGIVKNSFIEAFIA